ncbi:MAG: hypothetical protein FJ161_00975, partial [Gammaproteobacteria bacterium]|nr:hypothetical protein [Gammaproteobacteria bacterium]
MKKPISIVWFRKDLRLTDNLAFYGAANCSDILPIYIFDDLDVQGSASNVWLNHSLAALDNSLDQRLNVYHGKSDEIIDRLIAQYAVKQIFMNICYEPEMRLQEQKVRKICDKHNVVLNNSSSNYLQKPEVLLKNDGTPYKVFTPFKKRLQQLNLRSLVPKPHVYSCIKDPNAAHIFIKPTGWALKVISNWTPGENAAQIVLKEFICNGLKGYGSSRNMVAEKHISRLSPYLHFG